MDSRLLIHSGLLLFFLASALARAQVTTGTILGTVSDASGAVVPRTTVTLRNVETGISRTVTADERGMYTARQLGLGNYEVTAEASGFQTVVRTGITLAVGQEVLVNFTLQVGAVAERITITGEAPIVETTSSSVNALVEGQTIRDMPLNGRSFDQLITLQPGVFLAQPASVASHFQGNATRYSVAGARPTQTVFV